MLPYSEDRAWEDVVPLPQDDGSTHPLAAIAYSPEYVEAMSYMRAIMAQNEFSERALDLTEDIIAMNPAHYTVWLYRSQTITALDYDRNEELKWLNETALANLKNYQIWHHRQSIIEALAGKLLPDSAELTALLRSEADFVALMFSKDAKNYHVWSYRQWLVKRFGLWDSREELDFVEDMLRKDVRNNSAWNHRWFIVFGRPDSAALVTNEHGPAASELGFAQEKARLAPQNECPWNYMKGILRLGGRPVSVLESFVNEFAALDAPDEVQSSHALDVLADIYKEKDRVNEAGEALDLLAGKYDPIRRKYWMWRKSQLGPITS